MQLPKEFTEYRRWAHLLKQPMGVPIDLWLRCMAPTEEAWRRASKTHGPHNQRLIQVYANPLAYPAIRDPKQEFPTGAILVKEKLTGVENAPPAGVAIMIKRNTRQFASSGGGGFLYFPSNNEKGVHESCAGCHAGPPRRVFGTYPSWEK